MWGRQKKITKLCDLTDTIRVAVSAGIGRLKLWQAGITFVLNRKEALDVVYVKIFCLSLVIAVPIGGCNHSPSKGSANSSLRNCEPELNGDGSIRRMICR